MILLLQRERERERERERSHEEEDLVNLSTDSRWSRARSSWENCLSSRRPASQRSSCAAVSLAARIRSSIACCSYLGTIQHLVFVLHLLKKFKISFWEKQWTPPASDDQHARWNVYFCIQILIIASLLPRAWFIRIDVLSSAISLL